MVGGGAVCGGAVGNNISTWYSQNEQLWFKRDANKVNVVVAVVLFVVVVRGCF